MGTYAQIVSGSVVAMDLWNGVDPWSSLPGAVVKDVTNVSPQPQVGWTYANDVFTAPTAAPVEQVPSQVTRFQAEQALANAGLLSSVQTYIAGQPAETQLAWATVDVFMRDSPMIMAAGIALGMTSAQLDALFVSASLIDA
jgi:hypothetical protein